MGVLATADGEGDVDALRRAAGLLRSARLPIIGGLRTDIAGAEAALALAKSIGGVIDHEAGESLTRASAILRDAGGCPASFGEVRNRADLVVLIGDVPAESRHLISELFPTEPGLPRPGDHPRELVVLGGAPLETPGEISARRIGLSDSGLPAAIAALAALVAERPVRETVESQGELAALAVALRNAAFPVLVYSPGKLDPPVIHVVLEIVRRLCVKARAAAYSLPPPGNGLGVNLCATWTMGLPVRTRFTKQGPQHDPWLYATGRLIDSGEADALLWIDALGEEGAGPPEGVPTVLLTVSTSQKTVEIVIKTAASGRDRDGALFLPHLSGIGMVRASGGEDARPTAAEVLSRLSALIAGEGSPC